ncbi:STAS domain-containing protein [Tumebacillus flagellatus]|nr:STAS domain-containing protein [Tumebacillus flagellatus]
MVSIGTFDWKSLRDLRKLPFADTFVMIVTVIIVVWTSDLSKGVLAGVVISALVYGWKSARIKAVSDVQNGVKTYRVTGPLFFATASYFYDLFEFQDDPEHVVIDFTHVHVWDHSAVVGISKVAARYESFGKHVKIAGLNLESETLVNRVGI